MAQIFIVDDSISVRKALEITFKRHALSSLSAMSGEEALETLLSGPDTSSFDLLMVDVIMPGMSGLELCSTLRQQPRFQSLPVILMSGNVDDDIRQQARDAGATAVLRKPFSPDELMPMVEGLLSAREVAAPAPDGSIQPGTPAGEMSVAAPELEQPSQSAQTGPVLAPEPSPTADAAEPGPLPAAEAAEPNTPPEAPVSPALSAAERLITHYQSGGRAESLALLNAQNTLLGNVGQPLDPKLLTFAAYFVNTARVVGQQCMAEPLQTVTLRYARRDLILHVHQDFTLLVITRAGSAEDRLLN